MSDNTFEYITTDYLVQVDETEQSETPIEYIIELGEQGLQGLQGEKGEQGFSPIVGYIWNTNTIQFTLINETGTETTPNLYDYVANKTIVDNHTTLINNKLDKDGSNAQQNITIRNIKFNNTDSGTTTRLSLDTPKTLDITNGHTNTDGGLCRLQLHNDGTAYLYGYSGTRIQSYDGDIQLLPSAGIASYNGFEIATVNGIHNSTITITQGGVTKGTFTLNQSTNGTIDLDAGGALDVETNKLYDVYNIDDTDRIVGTFLGVDITYDSSTRVATVTPSFTSEILRQNYDTKRKQWTTVARSVFYPFIYDVVQGDNITITKNNGVATISSTGGVEIDDSQASSETTYSSTKVETLIQSLSNRILALENNIDGGNP